MSIYEEILKLRDQYRKETGKSTVAHPAFYIHWLEQKLAELILNGKNTKT